MLEAEIEAQGEVDQGSDQCTSMPEKQHKASQRHSLGFEGQSQFPV